MPRTAFRLPDVGEGIAEAELVAWHVKPGERIAEDDPLLDVMTDKATVEIPSPISGLVVSLIGAPGEKLAIGSEIAVFERDGAEAPPPAPPPPAATPPPAAPAHKVLAAPAVRERARRLGIELAGIAGTGACGRITHEDLDRQHRPAPASMPDAVVETPMIGLRRRIAERLQDAAQRIPHFTYVEEIDVGALEDLRASLNAAHPGQRLTVLPFLIRALVRVLPRFPQANAHYDEAAEVLRQHSGVHVGIATATPQGLLVPVLRHAERETLSGSTITVTSLGLLGGIVATPIINTPEVAIVGVNRIVERPVVRGGAIVIGKVMNLSCSFDHRVLDGWEAASFVQAIKALLEQPALLFIDKGEKP